MNTTSGTKCMPCVCEAEHQEKKSRLATGSEKTKPLARKTNHAGQKEQEHCARMRGHSEVLFKQRYNLSKARNVVFDFILHVEYGKQLQDTFFGECWQLRDMRFFWHYNWALTIIPIIHANKFSEQDGSVRRLGGKQQGQRKHCA